MSDQFLMVISDLEPSKRFLCCWRFMYVFKFLVKFMQLEKIAAHSAYDMFSWYKYLIVNLVFSHLGFWSGNLFLIATFPDRCLLVPFFFPEASEEHLLCSFLF